jgi:hypothetical protein
VGRPLIDATAEKQAFSYPKLLDWLRYFCAFMLFMCGFSKLLHWQFNLQSELAQRPIGSLTGYQLTWYYYGYSKTYACLLGLTQVAGASLLLFRKTALLAALLMTPVMVNILMINIFILVNDYGPYVISALILASMLLILWHERLSLVSLLWSSQVSEAPVSQRTHRWIRRLIVVLVIGILIAVSLLQYYFPKHR